VQLELAPAEIALVYKQGLARGAEVCRQGTHEWRPLVTTPELRAALAAGRGLITLARRPLKKPTSVAPPPPAVVKRETPPALTETLSPVVAPRLDSTLPRAFGPLPPLSAPPRPRPTGLARLVRHARPVELALAAGVAMLFTWTVSALSHRSSSLRGALSSRDRVALATPIGSDSSLTAGGTIITDFGPKSSIPVVSIADLPVEGQQALRGASMASVTPRLNGLRGELTRALGNAARAAQSCGSGPVNAQVVATFRRERAACGAPLMRAQRRRARPHLTLRG
jgi:hypothetical protein